jgi:hypothetical protein
MSHILIRDPDTDAILLRQRADAIGVKPMAEDEAGTDVTEDAGDE